MGFWSKLGSGLAEAAMRSVQNGATAAYRTHQAAKFGGKTLDDWERHWRPAGSLHSDFSHLSQSVGLYRARLGGRTMYIGRAVEWHNGGLRKRLRDYTRQSDSSRTHGSGRLMHEHASSVTIDVLVTGDNEEAAQVARQLEVMFVGKYRPEWNVQLK